MHKCPVCNTTGNSLFCSNCGSSMMSVCQNCGCFIQKDQIFCGNCGARLEMENRGSESGSKVVGDIGMLKGDLDQSTHITTNNTNNIGSQTNISGPVNVVIQGQSHNQDFNSLLRQGLLALQSGLYDSAIENFQRAANLNPQDADLHFYLALASLRGKRPRLVDLKAVQEIERHLKIATQLSPDCSHAYILWALVIEDYFVMNHIPHQPAVDDLLNHIVAVDRVLLQKIVTHVPATQNRIMNWLVTL